MGQFVVGGSFGRSLISSQNSKGGERMPPSPSNFSSHLIWSTHKIFGKLDFFWIFLSETQMTLLVSMENSKLTSQPSMYREKSTECTCSMERKYKFRNGLDSRFRKLFGRLWNVAANFSQMFLEESHLWQICENWVQNKRWWDLPVKRGKHEKNNHSDFLCVVYWIRELKSF